MLETLGQYKILDRIGAGGIGEIYRARDTQLGRTVALKLLISDVASDGLLRDRFLRDAHATTVLSHPNIASLYRSAMNRDTCSWRSSSSRGSRSMP